MNFSEMSLIGSIVVFTAAAVAVWQAGAKITDYADELAERFNLSRALLGLLMLAGVTSLPEIATSLTAAVADNPKLAVNNLLGSIATQVAILAVADGLFGKRAMTSVVPDPVVILQGALNIVLLTLVATAAIVGDLYFLGAGGATYTLCVVAVYSLWKLKAADGTHPWVANTEARETAQIHPADGERALAKTSLKKLVTFISCAAAVILAAGFLIAQTGEVIAQKTGLGSSFVGVAFVAIATSLPEASTVFAAMRRRLYTMAISDILGTNILNIVLIFVVDAVAPSSPVLANIGDFAAVSALLGLLVTALFVVGIAERSDRTIGKFGLDSVAVLLIYLGGMTLLFTIRGP